MNGVHDLGGMHGFGPVVRETQEPYFHEDWERRVFALFFGGFAGGHFNVDMFRAEIERMPGHEYLRSSYYEHWLHALEALLVKSGAVTESELRSRIAELAAAAKETV
ncbi:MAG: hypothetical protein NVS9B10_30820 [Nevskia sp.]